MGGVLLANPVFFDFRDADAQAAETAASASKASPIGGYIVTAVTKGWSYIEGDGKDRVSIVVEPGAKINYNPDLGTSQILKLDVEVEWNDKNLTPPPYTDPGLAYLWVWADGKLVEKKDFRKRVFLTNQEITWMMTPR